MTHHLNLEVSRTDGVLNRVLGMAERRGWTPESFNAEPTGEGTFNLALTVRGERPIELLIRQLDKLFDVLFIELDIITEEREALTRGALRLANTSSELRLAEGAS